MQPGSTNAWQQARLSTPTFTTSAVRRLDAHAQVFTPRAKSAIQPVSGACSAGKATDKLDACHTWQMRTADSLIRTPCSTSSRSSQVTPASRLITCHQPRNVRAHATAAISADETLQAGCIVAFQTDTKQDLALLQRPNGKQNWFATDIRGNSHSLKPQQIAYLLPGNGYKDADLQQIHTKALNEADVALLADAWEMVQDDEELYSVQSMAELLFGNTDAVSCYASHRLLSQERMYFKQAGRHPPLFQARAPRDVHALRVKRDLEEQAERARQDFAEEMQKARKVPHAQKANEQHWQASEWADRLQALQAFALDQAQPSELSLAIESLQACKQAATSSAAVELLQSCGWWRPNEQISLLKADRTDTFPKAAQERASFLISSPPAEAQADSDLRQDLTLHEVITIDDAGTQDVDDGLSVETLPSGQHRLWVHIADPARWVTPEDVLDVEARRRAKTVYIPTGNIPMFPRDLADGLFSLRLDQPTPAMSVHMTLAPDGCLQDFGVQLSCVRPSRKMTYAEVDELLDQTMPEQEPALWALHQAAEARHRYRLEQGALSFQMPEPKVQVQQPFSPDASVQVHYSAQSQRQGQASQLLVSELMILAGEAVATLGQRHSIPLPYRGQMQPVLPTEEELEGIPEGYCQDVMVRSRMVRSIMSTDAPTPHAGLGLPGYVQFTSPIRRYGDLLAHRQIKAFLRGEPMPFTAYQLSQQMEITSSMTQEAIGLEREVTNYWLALFFQEERKLNKTYKALLLAWIRSEAGLARILLEDLGLEAVVKVNRPARVGDRLRVSIGYVDVPKGVFKFEESFSGSVEDHVLPNGSSDNDDVFDSAAASDMDEA